MFNVRIMVRFPYSPLTDSATDSMQAAFPSQLSQHASPCSAWSEQNGYLTPERARISKTITSTTLPHSRHQAERKPPGWARRSVSMVDFGTLIGRRGTQLGSLPSSEIVIDDFHVGRFAGPHERESSCPGGPIESLRTDYNS